MAFFKGKKAVSIKVVFGKVLKELRGEKGISQEKLALDAGIDRSYISKLETGVYQPSLSMLFAIADVLQVAPDGLVRRVAEKHISENK